MKLLIALLVIVFIILVFRMPSPNRYIPTAAASGGLSPEGGMRDHRMEQTPLKYPPMEYNHYETELYDDHTIPRVMTWKVGHWSS